MFEWLKEKLHLRRKDEITELLEHTISPKFEPISHDVRERFDPGGGFAPRPEPRHEERFETFPEPRRGPPPAPVRKEEAMPTFETFEDFNEPTPEPPSVTPSRDERSLERIEDEIRFIKEQLSAIKAIVETINEKVKNIQRDVERRY